MQSKKQSLTESVTNIMVGYLVSLASQIVVFPLVGIQSSLSQNLMIGFYFTLISLVRSYLIRRVFNKQAKHRVSQQEKLLTELKQSLEAKTQAISTYQDEIEFLTSGGIELAAKVRELEHAKKTDKQRS